MQTFSQLNRNLKKDFTGFKKIKFAIVADSASQFINKAIKAYGYEAKIDFDIYEADYSQIDMQVLDTSSELYKFQPDFIYINKSSEHLLKEFYKLNRAEQCAFSNNLLQDIQGYCQIISSKLASKIIISTFPEINDTVFGNFAAKTNVSFIYQIRRSNFLLMEYAQQTKQLFLLDLAALQSTFGYSFIFDSKMYVSADMVYSIDFLPHIAKHIIDIILSITGTFKKCLVLDLDNTLWGGIIGDDGIEGIQIGYLGLGKIFTELQLWVKQLKQRGIILAVCSKNTESIAKEPFEKHPEMILRLEDIALFVANWETKVTNIKYIQQVLNIGFDSMVFLDDNPFEREMVKSGIPEIAVPALPEDPSEYLIYLRGLNLFETASFTDEDMLRTQQYQQEAKRTVLQQSFASEEDFLKNLEMVSDVKPFDSFSIPRVAQLTQRSNQFNLRTIRYSEKDIEAISKSKEYYTFSLTLHDKFGDHGLIAVIILKKEDDSTLFIDTWIMSCRVLKRGMENFTLNQIIEWAKTNNFSKIKGEYVPTKKNGIVKDHFLNLGFTQAGDKWLLRIMNFSKQNTFINKK
jgi:FkbH-like protein